MHYQDINEILAKGIKLEDMSPEYVKEISDANAYLVRREGEKPVWLDDFLESNRCKLVETICRATSAAQGISSLQGYREGYFNEIIQNANDLHCGDSVCIIAGEKGNNLTLKCRYDDEGFSLSNIYAFLNREMSDKTDDDSQTGKFGVGIKSFFKFAESLRIESNVLFDFSIDRTGSDNNITGTAKINPAWSGEQTSIFISYDPGFESEFNTGKLSALIKCLCGRQNPDVLRFFLTGDDSEMVFDIRSLIFMRLNGKTRQSVSDLEFRGKIHNVKICCRDSVKAKTVTAAAERWKTGEFLLNAEVDQNVIYEKEYIVFSDNNTSAAFPVSEFSSDNNRMYATYYLKTDTKGRLLPIGMLADSKYANIHRNDVGDSEEKINEVYDKLRGFMKSLYGFMCSEEAAGLSCADAVSDVFHNIIARYLTVDSRDYPETPLQEVYYNNSFLPKKYNEKAKTFVIEHKRKEAYDSASYQEGDIIKELKENYFEFVEKKNAYDLQELISDSKCINGVCKVYGLLSDQGNEIPDQNRKPASEITNYFSSVGEYLVYEISKERRDELFVSDAEIDVWLLRIQEEAGNYFDAGIFLKLVGRYGLNEAIAYDGSIRHTNLSFKDYLFNGILTSNHGLLSQYQNQFYDKKYFGLKQELLQKRYQDYGNKKNPYMIRCVRPVGKSAAGWDGTYDFYEMCPPQNSREKLSEPQLLLERMAFDGRFTGLRLSGTDLTLFETKAKDLRKRDYRFRNYTIDEQQMIQLSCMRDIHLESFADFINAVKYRSMLSEELQKYIHISCREKSISTRDIAENVLPVMVESPEGENRKYLLNEFVPSDVEIAEIVENSNNEVLIKNAGFVYKITGYQVHVYRFASQSGRRILAYFGEGKCQVKTDAAKKFREVAKYCSTDKNVYIFYDNIPNDIQQAVTNVLDEVGVNTKKLELLEGYIHNGNSTKTMSYMSRRRNLARVKKKLLLDWIEFQEEIEPIYDTEILYRLLSARGSYDIFCPICSDIPVEMFDYGEDTKKKHSRRIILLENENPDTNTEVPYIVTVSCPYCCQRLRSTLIKSEFDGENIILTTEMAHGLHEKTKSKQQIELSPVNIEVMKKFRLL
ncbi:MAG: hypothetical protein LIO75_00425 [Lachnospiraceae bacterium]|nr:hypothetical protein [Lachnospiraceae bacterium]